MPYYLVLALVVSPMQVPRDWLPGGIRADYWTALKEIATATETAGQEGSWSGNFPSELIWVRLHSRQALFCPRLADCRKLPPFSVCQARCRAVCEYRETLHCIALTRLHWADRIVLMDREASLWIDFWKEATVAQDPDTYWCNRRCALGRLRVLLGEDVYYSLWNFYWIGGTMTYRCSCGRVVARTDLRTEGREIKPMNGATLCVRAQEAPRLSCPCGKTIILLKGSL